MGGGGGKEETYDDFQVSDLDDWMNGDSNNGDGINMWVWLDRCWNSRSKQ